MCAHPDRSDHYAIRIRGVLGETLLAAFPTLHGESADGETVLTGCLPDQAALYGVLGQIEALGLELLSLRREPTLAELKNTQLPSTNDRDLA